MYVYVFFVYVVSLEYTIWSIELKKIAHNFYHAYGLQSAFTYNLLL